MLESLVRAFRRNLESLSGNPSIRTQARRVQELWNRGRLDQSRALAEALFRERGTDPRVAVFYTSFVFETLGDRALATEIAVDRLTAVGSPSLLFQVHRLCSLAGNKEFLINLSRKYFQHPKLAGPAYLAYGSALLDKTGDFGLAAGFFNRAAVFGRLGCHSDPAELAVSPHAFSYFAELPLTSAPITLKTPPFRPRAVVFAVGDRQSLSELLKQAVGRRTESSVLFHFHVTDPSARSTLERDYSSCEQISWSFEVSASRIVKPQFRAFELLPSVLEHYECPVLAVASGTAFADLGAGALAAAAGTAQGMAVTAYKPHEFPWQAYSPELTMFSPTAEILHLSRAFGAFLLYTPAANSRRHLLALALAECVHAAKSSGARVLELSTGGPAAPENVSWP